MLDTIETGRVDQPEQFKEICTRLVSKDTKFCPGLDKEEYQHYRDTIRYDLKNVRIATSPIERIDSCKCRKWFRVPKNAPLAEKSCESVMCSACKELRKRLRQASERISQAPTSSKMKHIQPSSHFPLKYLSPNSLKERRMNTQAERSHDKRALRKYEPQDVVLDDSQHDEMCQVVSALESHGRSELEGVFAEADAHGVGTDIRKTWENDKHNLKMQFQSDQLTLGND